MLDRNKTDFLVLGGGVAGLRSAIELASAGRVVIMTKCGARDRARGQIPAGTIGTGSEENEVALHFQETLRAGDGLCREEAVRILVEEGPQQIRRLMEWGARLNLEHARIASPRKGTQPHCPLLPMSGDSTASEIFRTLASKAKSLRGIHIKPGSPAMDLLIEGGRVKGAEYFDQTASKVQTIEASAVLIATGGLGYVYKETTSPPSASGDGVAMAYRAGAPTGNLEFIQFHPTVLYVKGAPRILLPEGLRREGGFLRDIMLERFMSRHHDAGDLAPRDVVSRAIVMELVKTRSEFVYLDLTHLNGERIKQHFAAVYANCLEYNLDITTDLIPVRPAAHRAIGGVVTDLRGATELPGLYAAGEVAATGVHGANRLPSNSLLESLVFGARVAAAMTSSHVSPRPAAAPALQGRGASPIVAGSSAAPHPLPADKLIEEVRCILWSKVGIIRTGKELKEAVHQLDTLCLADDGAASTCRLEARNLLEVGRLVARCALARQESRGAHYRSDFPLRQDDEPPRQSYATKDKGIIFL